MKIKMHFHQYLIFQQTEGAHTTLNQLGFGRFKKRCFNGQIIKVVILFKLIFSTLYTLQQKKRSRTYPGCIVIYQAKNQLSLCDCGPLFSLRLSGVCELSNFLPNQYIPPYNVNQCDYFAQYIMLQL